MPDAAVATPLFTPNRDLEKNTVYLKQVIAHPNFYIGDWSFDNDQSMPKDYASSLASYLWPGKPTRTKIGRFCQIAVGTQIITTLANHPMKGMSAYPFAMLDGCWGEYLTQVPAPRDVAIGNGCWIGNEAVIMPGTVIGDGAIISTLTIVTRTVPDYAIVAGNPAQVMRMQFDDNTILRLKALAWWDWDKDKIEKAITSIEAGDLNALEQLK
ncbi:MAG: CatB-related O-acetyltransferase [Cognatishimia sp.]|uniref:CatB-related O-acetyltransferase n=1 Tax=Cognatishimia sp. TaxID=2211648 RepID=UPI003B8BD2E6